MLIKIFENKNELNVFKVYFSSKIFLNFLRYTNLQMFLMITFKSEKFLNL